MSAYMDLSASQLADCLEMVGQFPGNTGALSMLDEATLAYGRRFESVSAPQQAFAESRHAFMHPRTPAPWDVPVAAASALADALRPLGGLILPRCKREGPCGTCNMVLDDDGECRSSMGHTDDGSAELAGW